MLRVEEINRLSGCAHPRAGIRSRCVVSLQVVLDARAFPPTESQLADLLAETPVLVVLGGEDGTKET